MTPPCTPPKAFMCSSFILNALHQNCDAALVHPITLRNRSGFHILHKRLPTRASKCYKPMYIEIDLLKAVKHFNLIVWRTKVLIGQAVIWLKGWTSCIEFKQRCASSIACLWFSTFFLVLINHVQRTAHCQNICRNNIFGFDHAPIMVFSPISA